MAITHVNTQSTGGTANTSSITITKPTGLQVDDLMVAFCTLNLTGVTPPSGWTQYDSDDASSGNLFRSVVFYKVATSSDVAASNFTFDASGSNSPFHGAIIAYRGIDTSAPMHAASLSQSTTEQAVVGPSVTTTAPKALILHFRAVRRASATKVTFTGSGNERFDVGNNGASTSYCSAAYDSGTTVTPGSQSGISISASASTSLTDGFSRTIAIKEADTPASGSFSATLGHVVASGAGSVHDDAAFASTLGHVTTSWAGTHFPPSSGSFAVTLGHVSASFAATSTGGAFSSQLGHVSASFAGTHVGGQFASQLGHVTSSWTGDVNPIGAFSSQLSKVTSAWVAETQPFGAQVIFIEPEKRGLRITQDETTSILLSEVTQE